MFKGEFRNRGGGTFGSKIDYPGGTAPYSVAVADFNRDGLPDLLTTNLNTAAGGVGLLLGNGTGGFQKRTGFAAGIAPFAETVGDFNGDGNPDVAVASSAGATMVNVLLGNGNGTFQTAVAYNLGYQPLDLQQGDFNADGKADLVERTTSGFLVEAGNGDGTFQAPLIVAGSAGNSTLVADFNGDGAADIGSSNSSGTVTVQINANDGLSAVASASGLQMSVPGTAAAGLTTPVTVSAVDSNGNVATTFTGTVTVTTSDPLDNPAGIAAAGKGYQKTETLADCEKIEVRTYIPEPQRPPQQPHWQWPDKPSARQRGLREPAGPVGQEEALAEAAE